ncbi:MAG: Dabb family protein [Clostridia bacterium]|nr:Dabb family protein [Clostridia bacterium]
MKSSTQWLSTSLLALMLMLAIQAPAQAGEPEAKVFHVVICWLQEAGNHAARAQLIAGSKKLEAIPGVLSVQAGTLLASPRPIVDSSYDVGIIMSFASVEAMHAYLQNPLHKQAVHELLLPLTSKVVIYDFALPH